MHRGKPRKDALKNKIPKRIAKAVKAERARPSKEVDLLSIEEKKLVDLNLELLRLKSESETQGNAMPEEEDDTPTLEKSSKH